MGKFFRFLGILLAIGGAIYIFNLWREKVAEQEQEEWLEAVEEANRLNATLTTSK